MAWNASLHFLCFEMFHLALYGLTAYLACHTEMPQVQHRYTLHNTVYHLGRQVLPAAIMP